jgi:hypothetical protein
VGNPVVQLEDKALRGEELGAGPLLLLPVLLQLRELRMTPVLLLVLLLVLGLVLGLGSSCSCVARC